MAKPRPSPTTALLPQIQSRILQIRGRQVILSHDLAQLYGVPTGQLNQAVRRNLKRFPPDFMMVLTRRESANLRSQFVISSSGHGGTRYRGLAFTEQGVAMLSSVLNCERAVRVNIAIMRAFVRLRELMATHEDLANKLAELEERFEGRFQVVFKAIRQLMNPPEDAQSAPRKIGFCRPEPRDTSGSRRSRSGRRARASA